MDQRATESLLQPGYRPETVEDQQMQQQFGSSEGMAKHKKKTPRNTNLPEDIVSYIEENNINQVVKKALNKVLKDRPADPFSALAGSLFAQANKSFPVFDRFEATPTLLQDSIDLPSIVVKVYLSYQGRTELRHTHVFTYNDRQKDNFTFDKPDER